MDFYQAGIWWGLVSGGAVGFLTAKYPGGGLLRQQLEMIGLLAFTGTWIASFFLVTWIGGLVFIPAAAIIAVALSVVTAVVMSVVNYEEPEQT